MIGIIIPTWTNVCVYIYIYTCVCVLGRISYIKIWSPPTLKRHPLLSSNRHQCLRSVSAHNLQMQLNSSPTLFLLLPDSLRKTQFS